MRPIIKLMILLTVLLLVSCSSSGNDKKVDGASDTTQDSVEILANSVWPEGNHISQGLLKYSEKVSEETNGKVSINVNTGGALGYDGPEILKAVRDNSVPMSDILISEVAGDEKLFGVSTLPFLTKDFDEAKVLIDVSRPYYEKVAEEKWNQKVLYGVLWPYIGFWTKEPVEDIEDMKGLKMRTYDEMVASFVKSVGGSPSAMPFSDVYSSLSTGVIDSVMTSTPTAIDAKFWEVLDYYSPTNVTAGYSIVTMNLDEFNKLDQEDQDALVKVGKEMDEIMWENTLSLDEEMIKVVKEENMTIIEPSDEFMDKLSTHGDDITEKWLETAPPEAQEIIEEFNKKIDTE